jgi:hypothetical protein
MRYLKTKLILLSVLLIALVSFAFFYDFFEEKAIRLIPIQTISDSPISLVVEPVAEDSSWGSLLYWSRLQNFIDMAVPPKQEPSLPPLPETHRRTSYFDKLEGISFWGSLLYWRSRQSFMDIALRSKRCCDFSCPNTAGGASWEHAKRIEINPDYRFGFQVGFELAPANWGVFANYTHFDFHKSHSVSSFENGFLFGRWILPGVVINNSSSHINAKWSMRMNVLNFEAGRKCYFGRRLMLKPHFGLAGASIDQKLKGHYLLNMPENELKMHHQSDSWGVGPRLGGDMDLRLFRGFGIVGTAAADLLYTHYDLDLRARSPNNPTLFSGISTHLDVLRAELELYLGLNTHFRVSRRTFLNLELGYDFQIWWNQNMMRWNNDAGWTSSPEGNLYLEGLRLTLKFDF